MSDGTPAVVTPPPVTTTPPPVVTTPPPAFYETFADQEVKDLVKAKDYKSHDDLGLAYRNLLKLQNGATDVIGVPKDGDAAALDKAHAALGRPAAPTDYKFTFPEGSTVDPEFETFTKELLHGLGATPAKAQEAVTKWSEFAEKLENAEAEKLKTENETAVKALKDSWGAGINEHIAAGQASVRGLGLDVATLDKLDSLLGVAPVMKLLATIGKKIPGERTLDGNPIVTGGALTKEAAQARINALQGDTKYQDSMRDIRNPNRMTVVNEWNELHRIASGK